MHNLRRGVGEQVTERGRALDRFRGAPHVEHRPDLLLLGGGETPAQVVGRAGPLVPLAELRVLVDRGVLTRPEASRGIYKLSVTPP